jgi:hypothetical protein
MHTLHWVAIKAESKEEALATVNDNLLPNEDGYRLADWSDWFVAGGGRYNDKGDGYTEGYANMVISYAETPDKFKEVINNIKTYRKNYMGEKLMKLPPAFDKLQSDIVDYISNDCKLEDSRQFDFSRWDIKDCISMLNNAWTPDSGFYDNQEFTSSLQYLEERLDNTEQGALQYLVPVDFHF